MMRIIEMINQGEQSHLGRQKKTTTKNKYKIRNTNTKKERERGQTLSNSTRGVSYLAQNNSLCSSCSIRAVSESRVEGRVFSFNKSLSRRAALHNHPHQPSSGMCPRHLPCVTMSVRQVFICCQPNVLICGAARASSLACPPQCRGVGSQSE